MINFSLFPIPLLSPPPSQREGGGNYRFPIPLLTSPFPKGRGEMFCFFFLPKGRGKLKETLPRLSFHEVKILAGGRTAPFLSILASYPLWFGVDKNGAVAIILFLPNQKERENYLFGNKEGFSLFHRESF